MVDNTAREDKGQEQPKPRADATKFLDDAIVTLRIASGKDNSSLPHRRAPEAA